MVLLGFDFINGCPSPCVVHNRPYWYVVFHSTFRYFFPIYFVRPCADNPITVHHSLVLIVKKLARNLKAPAQQARGRKVNTPSCVKSYLPVYGRFSLPLPNFGAGFVFSASFLIAFTYAGDCLARLRFIAAASLLSSFGGVSFGFFICLNLIFFIKFKWFLNLFSG